MISTSLGLSVTSRGARGVSPKVSETEAQSRTSASGACSAPESQVTSCPNIDPMERAMTDKDWPRISNQVFWASPVSTVSSPAAFNVRVPAYSHVAWGAPTHASNSGDDWNGCSHHRKSAESGATSASGPVAYCQRTSGRWSVIDSRTCARVSLHWSRSVRAFGAELMRGLFRSSLMPMPCPWWPATARAGGCAAAELPAISVAKCAIHAG